MNRPPLRPMPPAPSANDVAIPPAPKPPSRTVYGRVVSWLWLTVLFVLGVAAGAGALGLLRRVILWGWA